MSHLPTAKQSVTLARCRHAMNAPIYRLCRAAYAARGDEGVFHTLCKYMTEKGAREVMSGEFARRYPHRRR